MPLIAYSWVVRISRLLSNCFRGRKINTHLWGRIFAWIKSNTLRNHFIYVFKYASVDATSVFHMRRGALMLRIEEREAVQGKYWDNSVKVRVTKIMLLVFTHEAPPGWNSRSVWGNSASVNGALACFFFLFFLSLLPLSLSFPHAPFPSRLSYGRRWYSRNNMSLPPPPTLLTPWLLTHLLISRVSERPGREVL